VLGIRPAHASGGASYTSLRPHGHGPGFRQRTHLSGEGKCGRQMPGSPAEKTFLRATPDPSCDRMKLPMRTGMGRRRSRRAPVAELVRPSRSTGDLLQSGRTCVQVGGRAGVPRVPGGFAPWAHSAAPACTTSLRSISGRDGPETASLRSWRRASGDYTGRAPEGGAVPNGGPRGNRGRPFGLTDRCADPSLDARNLSIIGELPAAASRVPRGVPGEVVECACDRGSGRAGRGRLLGRGTPHGLARDEDDRPGVGACVGDADRVRRRRDP